MRDISTTTTIASMAAAPKVKTFDDVFPLTLPASATPPLENTIVEGFIAPWYALGWTFEELELWDLLATRQEWDKRWDVFSDSQLNWIDPRWERSASHYHRPMLYIMANGDALFKIGLNDSTHLDTLNASKEKIIEAAVDVLGLSEEKVLQLQWCRYK
ncbi:hypothetical protein BDZ89DRAFT_615823 [Hymenopellis radicata]|nr:hypothetical protein BDZ89DRAFT_615823 [Hymenopellis radicata]